DDQPDPVVGAQGLGVHAGHLGGDRDAEQHTRLRGAVRPLGPPVAVLGAGSGGPRGHHTPAHPARGPKPAARSASASARSAAAASSPSVSGTVIVSVTSRSPAPPPRRGTPLPRTRSVRPVEVPAGTFTPTRPSRVGTETVVPSASSSNDTGTLMVRLSPSRSNTGSGSTCTVTYRSPEGAPRIPAWPWPASRMR